MHVDRISTEPGFMALQGEWNSLLRQSTGDTIFLTWEWVASWWAAYGEGKQLLILVSRDPNGACLGIAPLYIERGGMANRRVRFIGDGTFDSDYLDFIIPRGREGEVVAAFLDRLKAMHNEWDFLQLSEIPQDSPNLEALRSLNGGPGWYLQGEQVACGIRKLPVNWEEFLQTLRSRFRTTVRACLRNLEQGGGSFEILNQEEQIPFWLNDLFELHSGRWALRQQSGVFKSKGKREFYNSLAPALFRRGWLHMTRWRVNGVVLACQFGFAYQGVYYLLQEGFDSQCTHISPGITLRAATIRNLIAEGVHTYDFLGGIGRHKTDWGAQEKTSWRLAMAPKSVSGYARVELPVAIQKVKDSVKEALPKRFHDWWKSRRAHANTSSPDAAREAPVLNHGPKKAWKRDLASALYHTGLLKLLGHASRDFELRRVNSSRLFSLRRTHGPKFAILCYHRVGTGGVPLYSQLEPEVFEAQMRFLRARYRLVSLDALQEELSNPKTTEPSIAITFDDGYRDVYTHAFPVLQRYNIPATIFITAGAVESGEVSWYDKVFLALNVAPNEKLDLVLDKPRRFLLPTAAARLQAAEEIIMWLRGLPDEQRKEFCLQLEKLVPLTQDQVTNHMLTWEQIRTMHQAGICFGAHTLSHPIVSRLSPSALDGELRGSKTMVEVRLGVPVLHFAYPFGKPEDYKNTQATVEGAGFRTASTTVWGINTPGANPYELCRVSVGEERHLATFGMKLAQLFLSADSREAQHAPISVVSGDAACSSN
jgi:peptidoglycan/xylan/chitin deacetylase (PgdA/CDA1 family)/CelD/BcsL family acetyltransferase involved in cellulose biosynthesis